MPDRTNGSALFADISGFTPLTAILVQEMGQRRGAEELTRQVNRVYDGLIKEVHRYGGSVINFSGDAITCWFDGDDGRRGLACALAMQEYMSQSAKVVIGTGTVPLAIKVALAAGPTRRFLLGDAHVMLLEVLAGATIARMATAEKLANKNEVVASSEVIQALQDRVKVTEWRIDPQTRQSYAIVSQLRIGVAPQPWPALPADPEMEMQSRKWLLPAIYERVKTGQGRFLAEFRPVVALFMRFGGLHYDEDDAAGEKLNSYIQWVQQVLTRYEGNLIQVTIGDKGSYLYAVFGAPTAHEDDSDRAIATALQLRSHPAGFDFITQVQIGISRGRMRVGPYGSDAQRTYGAIGHETNMAARLMSQAEPGHILVSKHVVDSVSRHNSFHFNTLGTATLKGTTRAIPVYQVLDKRGTVATSIAKENVMIGRESEQQYLLEKLQNLASGQSQVVVVEGEAGIGKSRLVEFLHREAERLGFTTLIGSSNSIEQSSSYYPWRAVFSHLFELESLPEEVEIRRAHVLERLPRAPELSQMAPLLNDVLPLELGENELTKALSGQSRAYKTRELLVTILQRAAAITPMVLILEDAHWQDSASWALAQAVSEGVQPLLLVVVTRPLSLDNGTGNGNASLQPAEYSPMLTAPTTPYLSLKTLTAADTTVLVCQRLDVLSLPEAVSKFIWERAEGHPFFSEELAYALRDASLIKVVDGVCQVVPGAEALSRLSFPDTIEGVITSRIDRLTAQQQLVLKVSSVIGRLFALHVLRDIHPVADDVPELPGCLNNLTKLNITLQESVEPELTYSFKHAITHQVVYNLLLYAHRRDLHTRVAEWHERTHVNDLSPFYPLLAYHWQQAGANARTIEYLEKAGEQALRRYANQEAVHFLSQALKLARETREPDVTPLRQARWERQLAEAHFNLGQVAESREHLQRTLALLGWPIPLSKGGLIAGLFGQTIRQCVHRLFSLGRQVNANTARRTALLEAFTAYNARATIAYFSDEVLELLYASLRGLNLAEQAGPSLELAHAYAVMSVVAGAVPIHRLARAYSRWAVELMEKETDLFSRAFICSRVSIYAGGIGDWAPARALIEESVSISERFGNRQQWEQSIGVLAWLTFARGEYANSITQANQLYSSACKSNSVRLQVWSLSLEAQSRLRLGQIDQAIALLQQGLDLGHLELDRLGGIVNQGVIAEAYLCLGDRQLAQKAVEKAAALIAEAPPPPAYVAFDGYASVARVYLGLWEAELGADNSHLAQAGQRACKMLSGFARKFPICQPAALRYAGLWSWLAGQSQQANRKWRQSLAWAEKMDMQYEQGQAHYEIGRHLSLDDPRRQQHLARACEIFARLEAAYDLDQAQAAAA